MKLGRINFADLDLLLWDSNDHFLPMQDFFKGYDKAIYESVHKTGIISGCEVVPVSGLTVRVQEGLVLFGNGELAVVEEQDINLAAADPGDPRLDRIELAFSFINNVQVTKTDGNTAQFDKLAEAAASANAGTPGASPVAPTLTTGSISLGLVSVGAGATVVSAAEIDTSDDVADYNAKFQEPRVFAVPNSTSGFENIANLKAALDKYKQVYFDYQISRKTDDGGSGKVVSGTFHCMLNPETSEWQGSDDMRGNDSEDIGVILQVDPTTGQMQWNVSATGFGGANYEGSLTLKRRTLEV
jgi:hypothetical protein